MLVILQILKTSISILIVLCPIALFIQNWKFDDVGKQIHQRVTYSIVAIWTLMSLLTVFVLPSMDEEIKAIEIENNKPKIKIYFSESENTISVTMESVANSKFSINDLFFKFDIPGEIEKMEIANREKINDVQIYKSFLAGSGGKTIAETVHLSAKSFFKQGYFKAVIYFNPTKPTIIDGSEGTPYEETFMPLMDLHDYSRLIYTWDFKSEIIFETEYIDMSHLAYIKNDNDNLLKVFKHEDYYKRINPPNLQQILDSLNGKFSEGWLIEMEDQRKNW